MATLSREADNSNLKTNARIFLQKDHLGICVLAQCVPYAVIQPLLGL